MLKTALIFCVLMLGFIPLYLSVHSVMHSGEGYAQKTAKIARAGGGCHTGDLLPDIDEEDEDYLPDPRSKMVERSSDMNSGMLSEELHSQRIRLASSMRIRVNKCPRQELFSRISSHILQDYNHC